MTVTRVAPENDLLSVYERAWGIIANVSGSDWTRQTGEWRRAAELFRDAYHRQLGIAPTVTPSPIFPESSE